MSASTRPAVFSAEIVNIGDELLSGDVVNTNATFLADRCRRLGLPSTRGHLVRDRIEEIVGCLRGVAGRSSVCLVSGGLGPTSDDLTARAVATAFGRELQRDLGALSRLEDKYVQLGRVMPEANRKQADFPVGAEPLRNPVGTAEGFELVVDACRVFVMPGVPRELRCMMAEQVEPRLRAAFDLEPVQRRIYRTLGRGESSIAQDLEPAIAAIRSRSGSPGLAAVFVHYRASHSEVQIILEALPDPTGVRASSEELASLDPVVAAAAGPALYGIGSASLAQRVVAASIAHGVRLSTAESCTAGGVAARLGAIPGASACFDGSVVAYDNRIKTSLLGVPRDLLAAHGAVSEPVARAMARGARRAIGSDLSIAITGIAGPTGGTPEKPVGTVHIAVSDTEEEIHARLQLRGDRGTVQKAAESWALKLAWDRLTQRGCAGIVAMDADTL